MRAELLEMYLTEEQKKDFWEYMEGQTVSLDENGKTILSDSDVLDWVFFRRQIGWD